MLEAYGVGPYTGRELPDLQNRFFCHSSSKSNPARILPKISVGNTITKGVPDHDSKYFWAKTVEVEREAMTFEASHHTVIRSSFLQQHLVNCHPAPVILRFNHREHIQLDICWLNTCADLTKDDLFYSQVILCTD